MCSNCVHSEKDLKYGMKVAIAMADDYDSDTYCWRRKVGVNLDDSCDGGTSMQEAKREAMDNLVGMLPKINGLGRIR